MTGLVVTVSETQNKDQTGLPLFSRVNTEPRFLL